MKLKLPWPPNVLSPNSRVHYMVLARYKKAYRRQCALEAMAQGARAIDADRLKVTVLFYPPTRRRIDPDNCIARIKSGFDGLVDVLKVDDSQWKIDFDVAEETGGFVTVEIKHG